MASLTSLVNALELDTKDKKALAQAVDLFEAAEDLDDVRKNKKALDGRISSIGERLELIHGTKATRKVVGGLKELSDAAEAAVAAAVEEANPEALTTALAGLAKQVATGTKTAHALVALAGNQAAVAMSVRPLTASSKKLLRQRFDKGATPKYFAAQCQHEGGALTFVFDADAPQIARRLRQALTDQAGLHLKVRVRGPNGVVESAGDDTAQVGTGDGGGADSLAAVRARFEELAPQVKQMMVRPAVESSYQELRAAFQQKDVGAAVAAFSRLEAALAVPLPQLPPTPRPTQPTQPTQPPQRPANPPRGTPPVRPKPQQAVTQPAVEVRSSLLTKYGAGSLAALEKRVDRGGLKGTGEFGKLLETTKKLGKAMDATDDADRSGKQVAALERFLANAEGYLQKRGGTAGPFKDDIEKTKLTTSADLVLQTRLLLQEKRDAHRANDAAAKAKRNGTTTPGNGTSDVRLINGDDGEVAYAFKSVRGESTMMATPPGFATLREVMMSKLVDGIRTQSGLDFGWPKASLAKLDGEPGALIEGVGGKRVNGGIMADEVPAEAMQKILLCNLAGGQFDIKWEDVRFQGDDNKPVCMDGGAAMPDAQTATMFLYGASDGMPGLQIVQTTDPRTGQPIPRPEAAKKMSPDLVAKFLSIDTTVLKAQAQSEARALEQETQLAVGLADGVDTAILSIEGIQQILREANGDISTYDLLLQFHGRVVQQKLIEPNKERWEQTQLAEFAMIRDAHAGLFETADKFDDVRTIYREVLCPESRKVLQAFADMARPGGIVDLMQKHGKAVPTTDFGMAYSEIKAARARAAKQAKDGKGS